MFSSVLFIPLGKPADWAIYFACINFFFFLTWSKDLSDRFSRSFHQMEGICVNFLNLVLWYGNQLILGDFCRRQNWRLRSLLLCSQTKCTIVLQMHALIARLIALHPVKNGENWFSSFWVKVGEKMKIVLRLGRNWTIFVYLAYWRSETDWNITILISAA